MYRRVLFFPFAGSLHLVCGFILIGLPHSRSGGLGHKGHPWPKKATLGQ